LLAVVVLLAPPVALEPLLPLPQAAAAKATAAATEKHFKVVRLIPLEPIICETLLVSRPAQNAGRWCGPPHSCSSRSAFAHPYCRRMAKITVVKRKTTAQAIVAPSRFRSATVD